ncbi:hypothetical protein OC844_003116 [Tilletia horrida]|nr:hypothetical protein OC844_003116 [Tilletia horrida]
MTDNENVADVDVLAVDPVDTWAQTLQEAARRMLPLPYLYLAWAFKQTRLCHSGKKQAPMPMSLICSGLTGLPLAPDPNRALPATATQGQRTQRAIERLERGTPTLWPAILIVGMLVAGGYVPAVSEALLVVTGLGVFGQGAQEQLDTSPSSSQVGPHWYKWASRILLNYWLHVGSAAVFILLSCMWKSVPATWTFCTFVFSNVYGEEAPSSLILQGKTGEEAPTEQGACASTFVSSTSMNTTQINLRNRRRGRENTATDGPPRSAQALRLQEAIRRLINAQDSPADASTIYLSCVEQWRALTDSLGAEHPAMHDLCIHFAVALNDIAGACFRRFDNFVRSRQEKEDCLVRAALFQARSAEKLLSIPPESEAYRRSETRLFEYADRFLEDLQRITQSQIRFEVESPDPYDQDTSAMLVAQDILDRLRNLWEKMPRAYWIPDEAEQEHRTGILMRIAIALHRRWIAQDCLLDDGMSLDDTTPLTAEWLGSLDTLHPGQVIHKIAEWIYELSERFLPKYSWADTPRWLPLEGVANMHRLVGIQLSNGKIAGNDGALLSLARANKCFHQLESIRPSEYASHTANHADVLRLLSLLDCSLELEDGANASSGPPHSAFLLGSTMESNRERAYVNIQQALRLFAGVPTQTVQAWKGEHADCLRRYSLWSLYRLFRPVCLPSSLGQALEAIRTSFEDSAATYALAAQLFSELDATRRTQWQAQIGSLAGLENVLEDFRYKQEEISSLYTQETEGDDTRGGHALELPRLDRPEWAGPVAALLLALAATDAKSGARPSFTAVATLLKLPNDCADAWRPLMRASLRALHTGPLTGGAWADLSRRFHAEAWKAEHAFVLAQLITRRIERGWTIFDVLY